MDRLHICISMRSHHCLEKILQKSLRNGRMHFYIRSSVSYSKSKFQESGDSLPQIILFEIFDNIFGKGMEWELCWGERRKLGVVRTIKKIQSYDLDSDETARFLFRCFIHILGFNLIFLSQLLARKGRRNTNGRGIECCDYGFF